MPSITQLDPIFSQLRSQIEQFLLLLSQKEKFVIERRFNLDSKTRATLEEIGQHFHVTRERIRQIEKNALQKLRRNIENTPLSVINNSVFQHLQEGGGIMREDLLLSKLLTDIEGFSASALQLIISLDKRFERLPNTIQYHPHVRFKNFTEDFIENISRQSLALLRKRKDILALSVMVTELKKVLPESSAVTQSLLKELYLLDKSFKLLEENVGLLEWRHIHPRTLRDKIFYILRQEQKPLHFVELANRIMKALFDQKNVNLQAVHNELIRCEDFILIGRGIYALKEWGYSPGTVAQIITSILKKKASLSQEEIIKEVLKQRQVKPITIVLNLKNNPQFIRVGRKQYALKK